jgi:type IV pilus assembly protein PilP
MNASLTVRYGLIVLLAAAGLSACGSDMDDLDQYINQVKARPGGRIEPLPEITPSESFTYTLHMVGTLAMGGTTYGLVQTSDGLIHRVVPGNYMGQNDGRITKISESEIQLVEIISDGIGGYIERDAAISLSD